MLVELKRCIYTSRKPWTVTMLPEESHPPVELCDHKVFLEYCSLMVERRLFER